MFQIATKQLLEELNFPLTVFDDGSHEVEHPVFVGSFAGTKTAPQFFARQCFSKEGYQSQGCFIGTPHIPSFRQATERLFTFDLKVYVKGYDEYNLMWLKCKSFGKTAQSISTLTKDNQVIAVAGSLEANHYVSKTTGKQYDDLVLFANAMNFCGIKSDGRQSTPANAIAPTNVSVKPAFVPSADFDEIPF